MCLEKKIRLKLMNLQLKELGQKNQSLLEKTNSLIKFIKFIKNIVFGNADKQQEQRKKTKNYNPNYKGKKFNKNYRPRNNKFSKGKNYSNNNKNSSSNNAIGNINASANKKETISK